MLSILNVRAFFLPLLLCLSTNVFGNAPIQLGVVLNVSLPLKVDYLDKKGSIATTVGGGFGLLGSLATNGPIAAKNAGYAKRLKATMGEDFNRQGLVESALSSAFKSLNPQIELTFLSPDAAKKGKLIYKAVDLGATPYVVVINESSGLSYLGAGLGTLTAYSAMKIVVYDVAMKKRLFIENIYQPASYQSEKDINLALDDRGTYGEGYPLAIKQAADALFWLLNGKDVHHLIARGTSAEEFFPSMIKFTTDAAESFRLERPRRVDKWKVQIRTGSPFEFAAAPRKHLQTYSIRTYINVLAPELGQDFDTVEEFVAHYNSNLASIGWDIEPIQEIDTLEFKKDWIRYTLGNPQVGVSIFLHRLVEGFVVTHKITVDEEEPKELLTKYKSITEMLVDKTELYLN